MCTPFFQAFSSARFFSIMTSFLFFLIIPKKKNLTHRLCGLGDHWISQDDQIRPVNDYLEFEQSSGPTLFKVGFLKGETLVFDPIYDSGFPVHNLNYCQYL